MPASSRLHFTSILPILRPVALSSAALTLGLALTGCQTYTAQTQSRDDAVRSGNIAAAVAQADKDVAKNADNKDALLHRLEQGAILRAAALANIPLPAGGTAAPTPAVTANQTQTNQALNEAEPEQISPRIAWLTRSIAAFDEAARRVDDFEADAKIKVGSEAAALFTNQANTPYRGRAYDKVMLHTYQALNYLQLADADAARVELNRALQRQRDAVEANAKRIEEAQKLAEEAKEKGVKDEQGRQGSGYDIERAKSDPRTAAGIAAIESKFNAAILPYGDYVNPFTTFLDALVFTHQATDAADLERARKSWERVLNFAPQNPYVREDYVAVEPDLRPTAPAVETTPPSADAPAAEDAPASVAAGNAPASVPADTVVAPAEPVAQPVLSSPSGITYVIFETGSAPYRDQIRIDLPLFAVTSSISYVGMALPQLETVGTYASSLSISTSEGRTYSPALVASMDSVVAQDFKNEWPSILTKTILSTATKATIDAVLQKQIQDQAGATGALLFKLATAVTQAAINIADTRTWRSLPKEFQYARIPTPADRRLVLSTGGASHAVTLEPAAVQVVYVKSPGAVSPLLVGQFVLKK
jgi:Uncharacterized protein conserved in bacteria